MRNSLRKAGEAVGMLADRGSSQPSQSQSMLQPQEGQVTFLAYQVNPFESIFDNLVWGAGDPI